MKNNKCVKKFLDNNIPFFDIDKKMIPIINLLNFKVGLKTKFCCWGHGYKHSINFETYVIFDECVKEEEIMKLLDFLIENDFDYVFFYKWVRLVNSKKGIKKNWKMKLPGVYDEENNKGKEYVRNKLINVLKNYNA